MTTFIKTKFKKSDDQTNNDIYRIAANITEYHIISKLIFLRIIIPKFMKTRQLFRLKNVKNQHVHALFYIVPNSIRNHNTEFENHMNKLTFRY